MHTEEFMEKPMIGGVRLGGWCALAPMAGVSDLAYRVIARRMGAALVTTEMVSSRGLHHRKDLGDDEDRPGGASAGPAALRE